MCTHFNQDANSIFNIIQLQWSDHIAHAIKKSTRALNAIRLIKKFFTQNELLGLVTSNFYSILYYNSEIWHIPTLKSTLKQNLLSASAKALRVCLKFYDVYTSFNVLHTMCKRASPEQLMLYKLALCLFKLYNQPKFSTFTIVISSQRSLIFSSLKKSIFSSR